MLICPLPLPSWHHVFICKGFPDSSVGKESACNAGDPNSIPGLGRSTGEAISYPLQYSWASLVAQLVKNPPAMQETWVRSLGWEEPLEKGKATHPNILAWRISWAAWSMGLQRVRHGWVIFTFIHLYIYSWKKNVCSFKYNLQFVCSLVQEDKFQYIKLSVMLWTPSSYGFSQGSPAFPALSAVSSTRNTCKNDC